MDDNLTTEIRVRKFAATAHAEQRYGEAPYTVHLAAVRSVLDDFGIHGDIAVAAWLHDVVEDTPVTVEQLSAEFGARVAALVWAVTGRGANRKERVADAYNKIGVFAGPGAAILKLADRIANVEASASDPQRLSMYQQEQPGFESLIERVAHEHASPGLSVMLERLRRAVRS